MASAALGVAKQVGNTVVGAVTGGGGGPPPQVQAKLPSREVPRPSDKLKQKQEQEKAEADNIDKDYQKVEKEYIACRIDRSAVSNLRIHTTFAQTICLQKRQTTADGTIPVTLDSTDPSNDLSLKVYQNNDIPVFKVDKGRFALLHRNDASFCLQCKNDGLVVLAPMVPNDPRCAWVMVKTRQGNALEYHMYNELCGYLTQQQVLALE